MVHKNDLVFVLYICGEGVRRGVAERQRSLLGYQLLHLIRLNLAIRNAKNTTGGSKLTCIAPSDGFGITVTSTEGSWLKTRSNLC